ncbi:MAG: hypothetical protein LBN93_10315 [Candidatus Symbiothrix sp.]|nr:hypothetical protein [Candidatus Symbiothrix sp.]
MKKNNFRRIRMGLRVKPAMTSSSARITSGMTLCAIIGLLVIGLSTLSPYTTNAQISIGSVNDSVTVATVLDLSQGSGGLLLPQVTDTIDATRTAGMMVFSTADNKVYTYNGVLRRGLLFRWLKAECLKG